MMNDDIICPDCEEYLDDWLGSTHVDLSVDEGVGDAVVVLFERDVVVDIDPGFFPEREFVG